MSISLGQCHEQRNRDHCFRNASVGFTKCTIYIQFNMWSRFLILEDTLQWQRKLWFCLIIRLYNWSECLGARLITSGLIIIMRTFSASPCCQPCWLYENIPLITLTRILPQDGQYLSQSGAVNCWRQYIHCPSKSPCAVSLFLSSLWLPVFCSGPLIP